jgi:hypothetical protein
MKLKIADIATAALLLLCLIPSSAFGGRVLLDPAVETDPAYRFAADELAKVSGLPVAFGTEAREGDIAIGASSPAVRALVDSGQLSLPQTAKADGYAIRQLGSVTVVAGANTRGDLYGALWLAERARLNSDALRSLECVREPAFALRNFNDGHGHREPPGRGMDGWFQECLKYGMNTDTPILTLSTLRLAKAYHLEVQTGTGPFACLPVDDLIAKYGDLVTESPGQLCPLKPKVWEIYREQLRELLRSHPEVDFVRASLSDFFEEYHVYDCRGPNCQNLPDREALRLALQAAWDVVVGEFHKTFIISSWGNPPETYPLNVPADYRYIMGGLPDHGIISLVNNTQHDFYLTSPFNPVIGIVSRPQGMMFEVTPEYAGAGFFPVYIGPMIRERVARFNDMALGALIEGRLWEGEELWTRDVLWTRANMYALFRASWEPNGDPWEWARDWAALTFGSEGSAELADALCLTEELARRTFWVHGYSGKKAHAYAITHRNVITDGTHYFRWASLPHLTAYRQNQMRGKLREALASLDCALDLRRRMMDRWRAARALMPHTQLREACDRDFEHFSALVDVLNPYQRAMLLWAHAKDEGISTEEGCWASRESVRYARQTMGAWKRYRSRFNLYLDSGMTEMLDIYVRDCGVLSARSNVIAAQPGKPTRLEVSIFNNSAPQGLLAEVSLRLPKQWTASPSRRRARVAYGQRKAVAFEVAPPAAAPQGDAQIEASLAALNGVRAGRGQTENTSIRAKVVGPGGTIGASGKTIWPTTICPRAGKAPNINGAIEPGEWPGAAPAWVTYPLERNASTKNNIYALSARWMWDERYFYVLAAVTDEVFQPEAIRGSVNAADTIGAAFDLDGDRRDDYEIIFVKFADAFVAWPLTFVGVLTSSNLANRPRVEPIGRGIELAPKERPGGRVIEAAIPWSLLGGFKPQVGAAIGFAVKCNDADTPGRLRASIQWPPARTQPTGPFGSWAEIEKPTPFADLIFTK